MEIYKPDTIEGYDSVQKYIASVKQRSEEDWIDLMREYCKNDLFYLLNFVLSDGNQVHSQTKKLFHYHEFFLKLCRDTEYHASQGGGLDCSARGSGKSTVRSKAWPIQMILKHPDISIMIFSTLKKLAEKHLGLIKEELESNQLLKYLFPDIIWMDAKLETQKLGLLWSRDEGLTVKRSSPRRNCTVEVHAMSGGGPIGSRPDIVIADDIESSADVTSPENIEKLKAAFSETVTLMTPVAIEQPILMMSNTRFSEKGLVEERRQRFLSEDPNRVRESPGEDLSKKGDGPLGGTAMYPFTNKILWDKWNETLIKDEYGLQIALSYTAASIKSFSEDQIRFNDLPRIEIAKRCVSYICIDASRGMNDPTAIWVWGIDCNNNKHWLDGLVKKMDPAKPSFYNEIERIVNRWKTGSQRVVEIRVDQLGNQPWAELIASELSKRGIYDIPVIGCVDKAKDKKNVFSTGKNDRIFHYWMPMLARNEIHFPIPRSRGGKGIPFTNEKDQTECAVDYFLQIEFGKFPRGAHDDFLDAAGLICDEKANKDHPIQKGRNLDIKPRTQYTAQNTGRTWKSY